MEVVDVAGRASEVEFTFRRDGVEVWRFQHCCAIPDRDVLRAWLVHPSDRLVVDEVRFTSQPGGRIAISLLGVALWTMSPQAMAQLRQRL